MGEQFTGGRKARRFLYIAFLFDSEKRIIMKNSFGYDKSELRIKDPKSCGKEMRRKICINPQNESPAERIL